jgi:hypothetical protein
VVASIHGFSTAPVVLAAARIDARLLACKCREKERPLAGAFQSSIILKM